MLAVGGICLLTCLQAKWSLTTPSPYPSGDTLCHMYKHTALSPTLQHTANAHTLPSHSSCRSDALTSQFMLAVGGICLLACLQAKSVTLHP
jgi:hypothetical protein